jgi:hypothetical protein
VAHTWNSSDSRGLTFKASQVDSLKDPILKKKNPSQKKGCGVAQGVGPKFKPQYYKKKVSETV